MFNIQKAVSRLDYAPKLKEIEITDIKKGLGVFTPQPSKAVSFAALRQNLKKAGYALDSAEITIAGKLAREADRWFIVANESNQRFSLEGPMLEKPAESIVKGAEVEIAGVWKTQGAGETAQEIVEPQTLKEVATSGQTTGDGPIRFPRFDLKNAKYERPDEALAKGEKLDVFENNTPAPIRTTSPGLTVFQGGALTPRLYLIKQHLGGLNVSRQILDISVSYTPTPRLQLEAELPVSRVEFEDGSFSGSGGGLGNVTVWGKYRFFRTVKTYGDRQASARFGLELPTGSKDVRGAERLNASAFVRQQLTPVNGGLAPHLDLAFSQAGGRFIFGGNVEVILRTERDGFRLGHELRVNTDLEYVLLPFDYVKPGRELFLILESSFAVRGHGRLGGASVPGSTSTEYYLSPGLQYAAAPQFVIEGSLQMPVLRNAGPEVLRTDYNLLLGVKYLF